MRNLFNIRSVAVAAAALLLFAAQGCGVSKKCIEPQLELPQTIVAGNYADSLCMADMEWSRMFSDTLLQELIEQALLNNRDMLTATARVRELAERHRVARADFFPSIEANAYVQRDDYDYSSGNFVQDDEVGINASLSWELDFFGNIRWANRKALAEYMSSVEAQRYMQMTIVAEVATAYFELVALDKELDVVQRTLRTREENMQYTKLRYDGGLTTPVPYQQSQVEYAATASLVPDLKRQVEIKKNELSLLTGEFPKEIERSDNGMEVMDSLMFQIGIPSDLIRRRPDIREAELALKAAMADAGMAWADRFPRFTISLRAGAENDSFSKLLTAPFTYLAGEIIAPVFSFGKKQAQYKAAIQAYEQKRYAYEQKVMEAFKEVNDALVSYTSARERQKLMGNLKEASLKYMDVTRTQYVNGYVNYIDVLDAQRSYFNAEIDLGNAVRDEYIALVNLYKALGGGWQ